jgi:protein gp37
MGDLTDISWADKTFNGWKGCAKVSAACRFCYAERDTKRWGLNVWGTKAERLITSDAYWKRPHAWNRAAARTGETVRVFGFSWADVFERHPDVVDARQRFLQLCEATPALTWMLLTKRPENVAEFTERWAGGWPPNVWLGVSAEKQRFADERIPTLVQIPAAVRFVSVGPTLGAVDLTRIPHPTVQQPDMVWDVLGKRYGVPGRWQAPLSRGVDWVITEGESGRKPGIRPSHPDWFRTLRDQCVQAGVAFHHKQNGEYASPDQFDTAGMDDVAWNDNGITMWPDGRIAAGPAGTCVDGSEILWRVGRKRAGRLLDGQVWAQFPDEKVAA